MILNLQMKIFNLIFNDVRMIIRYHSILFAIPLYWCAIIAITYFSSNIAPHYSLYLTIFIVLVSYEGIYNNMFVRSKYEFRSFNVFAIPMKRLITTKNISNVCVTFFPVLIINSSLLLIFKLSFFELIESLLFFLPILFVFLALGNYFSVRSQSGEIKRKETSIFYLFIQQITFGILSAVYFVVHNVLGGGLYYILYLGIIIGFYLLSLKLSIKMLNKNKYLMLEI